MKLAVPGGHASAAGQVPLLQLCIETCSAAPKQLTKQRH